jgi:hypothetical protein
MPIENKSILWKIFIVSLILDLQLELKKKSIVKQGAGLYGAKEY